MANDDRTEWLTSCARAWREAQVLERGAAELLHTTILAAHDTGMSARAIAKVVGLSHQRVWQIINDRGGARGRADD